LRVDQPIATADQTRTRNSGEVQMPGVPSPDAGDILISIGEAFYRWDLATDALVWSSNAGAVLSVNDPQTIATGRGYAALLKPEEAQTRFNAMRRGDQRDDGHGGDYRAVRA